MMLKVRVYSLSGMGLVVSTVLGFMGSGFRVLPSCVSGCIGFHSWVVVLGP